jgi:hypothetical protein
VTRSNKGKRPKLDTKIKKFFEENVKTKEYLDEDYDVKTTVKNKSPATSNKGAVVKRKKNKYVSVSQNPKRNSTRATNKYRLRSKAMSNPSIKEENVIVIEDNFEDAKVGIKEKVGKPPLHKELTEKGKKNAPFPTGPVTRDTTRFSRVKAFAKGISRVHENIESNLIDSDHISYIPEAMDSTSSNETHNSGLASR